MISGIGLTKCFAQVTALNCVDFTARPGEVTAVLGPNGSGKSTLFRILTGVSKADRGQVTLQGRAIESYRFFGGTLGFYLDGMGIHPRWRVIDQLRILAPIMQVDTAQIEAVINEFGLSEFCRFRGGELSLGMRQRVGMAVAGLSDPLCLILDEPTNGLDPMSMRWLRELLRKRAEAGGTVVFSTHLMTEVEQIADRVVILSRGRVRWDSPLSEFVSENSQKTVVVSGRGLELLREPLLRRGLSVEKSGTTIRIANASCEEIGILAYQSGCIVTELYEERPSLEELYLDFLSREEELANESAISN